MKARVTVTLKSGILDPQGKAIEGALHSLGVAGVASVRQGKVFDIEIDGADQRQGRGAAQGGRRQAARQYRDRELPRRSRVSGCCDEIRRPRLPRHQSRARHGAHAASSSPATSRRWSGTPRRELPAGTDLVVIPGGFSYGDYLRCGAIAARAPIMDAVRAFAAKGGLVLGVCNGFQILCEAACCRAC